MELLHKQLILITKTCFVYIYIHYQEVNQQKSYHPKNEQQIVYMLVFFF